MRRNKKAVSMMVSYALLVVIAIGLSAIVYPFLKARLPADTIECPADLSISIEEAYCSNADSSLTISLLNRGLFNITGAYIRFGEEGVKVRQQVNKGKELYLKGTDFSPLAPGQHTPRLTYPIPDITSFSENDPFIVEVQPAVYKDRVLVPCANKIVTKQIFCGSDILGWLSTDIADEYSCEGTWWDSLGYTCANVHDQNWEEPSKGTALNGELAVYYVNYSTPSNAQWAAAPTSNWTVKFGNEEIISIASFGEGANGCWSETKLQFKVELDRRPDQSEDKEIRLYCRENDGDWKSLMTRQGTENVFLYEEKMNWQTVT